MTTMSDEAFNDYITQSNMLTISEFEKLPTKRKLVYYKKYRILSYNNYYYLDKFNFIKDMKQYVFDMKTILDKCEHIEK